MILITGATGGAGSMVVRELHRRGAKDVRALVRDPGHASAVRDAGFEAVKGDFDRPETLGPALEGVETALLLTPPTPQTVEHGRAFVEAARSAGVRRVVKLSALGADPDAPEGFGRWHGLSEEHLKSSGLAWTMLRPNFFMQNVLGLVEQIATTDKFSQPVGDARASFIHLQDVAAVAARVLTEDGHEGQTYTLTGPEALSYADVAARLSEALGRSIAYVPVTPEQFRAGALAAGRPEWLDSALERLNEIFAAGLAAAVTDDVSRVAGSEPTTFAEFARRNASAFRND
ncbi:MAG TPA: SDR family oxidoreductase [Pyrinomonadaceae bacterium]